MRNFRRLPMPGPGSPQDEHALQASNVVADDVNPERVGSLVSMAPGGVHLSPLHPVYTQEPDHLERVSVFHRPSVNGSRVRQAGRP